MTNAIFDNIFFFSLQLKCVLTLAVSVCVKWFNTCKCGIMRLYRVARPIDMSNTLISSMSNLSIRLLSKMHTTSHHWSVQFNQNHFLNQRAKRKINVIVSLQAAGYSTELKKDAIEQFEYPNGSEWQRMFKDGTFTEVKY